MTDPTGTAEALRDFGEIEGKPVLASWMGGAAISNGERILNRSNIPTFSYPDTAARLFNYMWQYAYNLRALYETPMLPDDLDSRPPERDRVQAIFEKARSENRTILTEAESKAVLGAYHIPITPMVIADTPDSAVEQATTMGYPVVLKLNSETVTHKTDVGGVQLNIRNEEQVRAAYERIREGVTRAAGAGHFQGVSVQPMVNLSDSYELIVGSSVDPQFGPVILFGTGGSLVEVFRDRSLALPPLSTTLARRMMEQTRIYEALKGVRGRESVDMEALENLMVRFSQLIVEQPWIAECDINPLIADSTQSAGTRRPCRAAPGRCGCSAPAAAGHPALPAAVRSEMDIRAGHGVHCAPHPPGKTNRPSSASTKRCQSVPSSCATSAR